MKVIQPKNVILCIMSALLFIFSKSLSAASLPIQDRLNALDNSHQEFALMYFQALTQKEEWDKYQYTDLSDLQNAIISAQRKQGEVKVIGLIIKNVGLIKEHYDDPLFFNYLKILLDNNILVTANNLQQTLKRYGDSGLNQHGNYLFAQYYFIRKNWSFTLQYLSDELRQLTTEDYENSLLMKGIALQHTANHRDAINFYEKIPASSKYFHSAQLNLAIANIKQGWWTQGHQTIKALLKKTSVSDDQALKNRLHITLGYSLINKAYYRNARKSFQMISLDSRYANQAIIGLALTAAQQDDFIGALNATRVLKDKNDDDLPVAEAQLLMPFFYEKTMQTTTAASGYTEATMYYESKIAKLTALSQQPINFEQSAIVFNGNSDVYVQFDDVKVDLSNTYPTYVFKLQAQMIEYQQHLNNAANSSQLEQPIYRTFINLQQEYQTTTEAMVKDVLNKKIEQLTSYLSQAKFGLARIYDNNTVSQ